MKRITQVYRSVYLLKYNRAVASETNNTGVQVGLPIKVEQSSGE